MGRIAFFYFRTDQVKPGHMQLLLLRGAERDLFS